jgi:Family of unknown function (DUF6356)
MWQLSKKHLAAADETYLEHLRFALLVGLIAMAAGLACIVHAILPAFCQKTCSRTVEQLQQLFESRGRWREVQRAASGALVFIMLVLFAGASALCILVSGGYSAMAAVIGGLALAIPITFLLTNPDLESVAIEDRQ